MTGAEWLTCTDPQKMAEFLRERTSDRKLRLFAAACCRTVWELLPDEPTRRAVQVAELAADGQVDPSEPRELLRALSPKVNDKYGSFLCGGHSGPGSTYAAMAATAALDSALTFTWYMGENPTESLTVWECVAKARAQHAKEEARERCWQELDESALDEEPPSEAWYQETDDASYAAWDREYAAAQAAHCALLREIIGNPFHPASIDPMWLIWNGDTLVKLAQGIYDDRAFDRLPILADALEEAGCADADTLNHCRGPGPHVRGCWVVDLLLGKQ